MALVVFWLLNVPEEFVQTTPALPTSFVTVAVKTQDCEVVSPPRMGVRVTLIGPLLTGVIVIVAAEFFEVSVTDVAVSVTVAGEGTAAGAV